MDVKESKEALVALAAIGKVVIDLAKDGVDFGDAVALGSKLVTDEKFRAKVTAGVQGIDKIPAELKDIAASEALDLVEALIDEVKAK